LGGALAVWAAPVFVVIAPVRSVVGSELSFAGGAARRPDARGIR
jgi:hypothetical protein